MANFDELLLANVGSDAAMMYVVLLNLVSDRSSLSKQHSLIRRYYISAQLRRHDMMWVLATLRMRILAS